MNGARSLFKWAFRLILLLVLFIVFYVIGTMTVAGVIPDNAISEPGLVSATTGLLIISLASLLVIAALILTSHWSGWKLAVRLALAYYGAVTFAVVFDGYSDSLPVHPTGCMDFGQRARHSRRFA